MRLALEQLLPDSLLPIFSLDDSHVRESLLEKVRTRVVELSGGTPGDDSRISVVWDLLRCLALLHYGADLVKSLPQYLAMDSQLAMKLTYEKKLDLQAKDPVDDAVELLLARFGHRHVESGGIIDPEVARAIPESLTFKLDVHDGVDIHTWAVCYLTVRLIHTLVDLDLFYAMHRRIPHYRELKITVYLLIGLSIGTYDQLHDITEVLLKLYYGIALTCKAVFESENDETKLLAASGKVLAECLKSLERLGATLPRRPNSLSAHLVSCLHRFALQYANQMVEAGQFHSVLWSLPMFKEAKTAFQTLTKLTPQAFSVLLIGESGTGKEAIANLFLKAMGNPSVTINCAGINGDTIYDDLIGSSEILGQPLVRQVQAIFLDELDRSGLDAQGGLLRLLDKPRGSIRVRSTLNTLSWDGIIIASATDRIYHRIRSGDFITDLLWRFDARVHIEPLRKMTSDSERFGRLVRLAIIQAESRHRPPHRLEISDLQLDRLRQHTWPGNLRELLQFADTLVRHACLAGESMAREERKDQIFDQVYASFSVVASRLSHDQSVH